MRRVRWAITGTAMSGLERRENAPPKCSSASHATSNPSESASAMRSSISAKRSPCDWPGASGVWKKRPNFMGPRHARMTCPNVAAEEASPLSSWCGRIARDRGRLYREDSSRTNYGKARPTHMRYEAPGSLEGAVALLAGATGDARVLAGGTDLLVQMRADVVDPELIVDIKKIPPTRALTEEKGGWRIGAAVPGAEVQGDARLKKAGPGGVGAGQLIGSRRGPGGGPPRGDPCHGPPA